MRNGPTCLDRLSSFISEVLPARIWAVRADGCHGHPVFGRQALDGVGVGKLHTSCVLLRACTRTGQVRMVKQPQGCAYEDGNSVQTAEATSVMIVQAWSEAIGS